MELTATTAGTEVRFRSFDDWLSADVDRRILSGETYPIVNSLGDVGVVLDVGANAGAASVLFARHYPAAAVHAFEPAAAAYELLCHNTAGCPGVVTHNFGLFDRTTDTDLWAGLVGPGQASIHRNEEVGDSSERVHLVAADEWWASSTLGHIDILKVDTEGCELQILRSLADQVAGAKAVYLEFHDHDEWRAIDRLLAPTHGLAVARMMYYTGEILYLRHDILPRSKDEFIRAIIPPG
jgi:FkbM family methyltransferase